MTEQTIHSRDIKIADVFQAFYAVPDYQREFVWEAEHVHQLLSDINAEFAGTAPDSAPEYFIGSIVVCPADGGILELIDGQQRMTTIYITLCAIRDRLTELGEHPPGALAPQIAAPSTDAGGQDHFRYRLELQYEDSGDVLVHVAENTLDSSPLANTRSITNIRAAYHLVLDFLRGEFNHDAERLRAFYGYLTNKVKLIRIQTENVAKALKIFETINDRGVGLDSMDLMKNLLFMKADRQDFETLKTHWKELQDTIFDIGEKPLRFLRYFIFSRYDVDLLREDEIYGWFSKNESLAGYSADPVGFSKELLEVAKAYSHFLNSCDHTGAKNRHLDNLQLLGGKAARQHLILLLAGRHLSRALFDRLAREVEDLFFVYVITREPTRDFERNFARWAGELRRVSNETELDAFIEQRFVPAKADLSSRFDDAFRRLQVGSVQLYRMRYVLAKLTQHIDLQAYGESDETMWLSRYVGGDYEVEHIFPQRPTDQAATEFGKPEDSEIADRLGNLVLIEKSINASLRNNAYSKKRDVYRQSRLLLTRALFEKPKVGLSTKIDAAVADLEPFPEWNEAAVIERQALLTRLARLVWRLPEDGGHSGARVAASARGTEDGV